MSSFPYYPNADQGQLLALREASSEIRAILYKLERTITDSDLKPFAAELMAIEDVISDSCVDNLLTEDEYKEGERLAEEERQHRLDVYNQYNSDKL